jgi:DNA-binding transcriptional LysR family regulator
MVAVGHRAVHRLFEQRIMYVCFMIDRRLHVLRMVRQHGTVTAAAHALHLTPSAVSQQLRSLARELDVDLLEPVGRRVRLTPAAEVLLGHADRLFTAWEEARTDLDAHRAGDRGPVRLCGFPSVLAALLPTVVADLQGDAPPLGIEVVQADPAESLDRLLAGAADLAILEAGPDVPATSDDRFEQERLFDDPLMLVVPSRHRLAGDAPVALIDAVDEDWVGGPADGSYHQIELRTCQRAGFTPRFVHRALDWSAYLAVVEAGLAVALLPRLAIPASDDVVALSLSDVPMPTRRVVTCVRRGTGGHPVIRRTRAALQDAAAAHAGG